MKTNRLTSPLRLALAACATAVAFTALAPAATAADLPGTGVTVTPVKSTIDEETFQTLVVMEGLKELGYTVKPIQQVDYPAAHLAVANGDATFLADHWYPSHTSFYENAGGDAKLWHDNAFIPNNLQGYFIDKKTADKYHISNIDQLRDPKIAKLFDTNGDGKADLTGCPPGWKCEVDIEHQLQAYKLLPTVTHVQGDYAALMADTITRYKRGEPVLYYTWMPYWVSNILVPGKDVVELQVPFSALPGDEEGKDTTLKNGKNYGFDINTQRIVANRKFVEANPAAKKFFEQVTIPVGDVNAENRAMFDGANKPADMQRHAKGWIKAHQKQWDQWLDAARAAAD